MRLDHLLSKEHPAPGSPNAWPGAHAFLVERWLFIRPCFSFLLASTVPCGGPERGSGAGRLVGTLLGPEGAAAWLGLLITGQVPVIAVVVAGFGFCPFLENCTVDASISCFCDTEAVCNFVVPSF